MKDLVIIGGGPAGIAAGIYAARKQLSTVLVAEEIGGQSVVSDDIQNWIGTPSISGADLAKSLRTHLDAYKGEYIELYEGVRAEGVKRSGEGFEVNMSNSASCTARAVLIASGAARRKLDVPGAKEFDQKGLTYCASCDGPLFSGQDVAVIGGGNAGFETAAQLLAYVKSVTLLDYSDSFKADPVTVEKVLANEHMSVFNNAQTTAITGNKFVTGLTYKDTKTGVEKTLNVTGVFVEIGMLPSTAYVSGLVEVDGYKRIKVDPKTQRTSVEGVWAAGDCTDELYHQNNIAAGDAVKALEDIYVYLKTR